jgi:hypothetical protein
MARSQKSDDHYSPEEAKERMKAALLGARVPGHMPIKAKKAVKKREPGAKPAPRSRSRQKINK